MNKDCFANQGTSCMILQRMECKKGTCAFYKTANERKKGQLKACRRLEHLTKSKQQRISWLYYRKRYPWRKETV